MTELVACAFAVSATPAVLFGVERAGELTKRRLSELNSSIDTLLSDERSSSPQQAPEQTQKEEERVKQENAQNGLNVEFSATSAMDAALRGEDPFEDVPEAAPQAPEKTQKETSSSDPLAWTDMVDEGVCFLDQLAIQRSRELKKAVAEWMNPKTQAPTKITRKIACQTPRAAQSGKPNIPKHESLLQEVLHETRPDSKVSFAKGSPEERYIFMPARAA